MTMINPKTGNLMRDTSRLKVAIKYLQTARELIEAEAAMRYCQDDAQDLRDAAEDLGPILCTLESFGG